MKKIFVIISCLSGLFSLKTGAQETPAKTYDGEKENLHVYLLIGQSNMAGRAPFSEPEAAEMDHVLLLNDKDQWEAAKNPLNRYSTIRKGLNMQKMNPGYSFAQTMVDKTPGVTLGLVVNAKGGTKIEQWEKGTRFYKEAIRRTKAVQKSGTLKGILWHQGESNNQNPDEYLEKLTALVVNLRKDLESPNLPFVAGQIKAPSPINDQIARLPKAVKGTGYASSEGLQTKDRWHFDAPSMKLLGQRYAEEILRLQK